MELRDKVVLVTGANGFVGSYAAQRLLAEGMRVRRSFLTITHSDTLAMAQVMLLGD